MRKFARTHFWFNLKVYVETGYLREDRLLRTSLAVPAGKAKAGKLTRTIMTAQDNTKQHII